jgi:eukaryotic-like serine/threonine-protein kinase
MADSSKADPLNSDLEDTGVRPGDRIADKYVIERIIGRGGMGVVVAAVNQQTGERVAIKLLKPEGQSRPDSARRFLREARAAVKIKGEHVARVIDVGAVGDERPYIVMEYLEGCDLGAEIRTRGPLSEPEAIDYVLQACEALVEAHALGIVHRDLKPSNLFLANDGKGGRIVKVLDFGVSKVRIDVALSDGTDPALTAPSTLIGSPRYMSPEQIRSAKDVDERTDVWALGIILYELLTGKVPFHAGTPTALLIAICADPLVPLRQQRSELSEALDAVVARCLEKRKEKRIQTVAELALALTPLAPKSAAASLDRISRHEAARRAALQGENASATPPAKAAAEANMVDVKESPAPAFGGMQLRVFLLAALAAGLFAALLTFLALSLRGPRPKTPGQDAPKITAPETPNRPAR